MTLTKRGRGRPARWPAHLTKQERDRYRARITRSKDEGLIALLAQDPSLAVAELERRAAEQPQQSPAHVPVAVLPEGFLDERHDVPLAGSGSEAQGVSPSEPADDGGDIGHAESFPNVADGMGYCDDVLAGAIPVCKWVRLACERHMRDVERIGSDGFPYYFDPEQAERALKIFQRFREIKGPRAGKYLKLAAWQKFILASAFGWRHAQTGARRYRYVLCYVPRGNGKTTMVAPVSLYMLSLDREGGAEVYAAAVTREQARLVFNTAQNMARREQEFRSRYGVEVAAHAIVQPSSNSTFRPLSRDAQSLDGLNVHCAVLDELAQHKTREVHDVLLTATGKRLQSMMIAITTAGSNQSGIGYEQWLYAQQVLEGRITDEQFFAILYTIDADDDWTSADAWRKANPNWGVSVMPDVIEQLASRAMQVAAQQNAFKQKHLNVWTNADVAWMDMEVWGRCADRSLSEADFHGAECIIALDLASRTDIAAKAKLFWREHEDGRTHYYLFCKFWLPEATVMYAANASYAGWEQSGWIESSPGEVNDFSLIEGSIVEEDARNFVVRDVAYDPWQSAQLAQNLDRAGVPVIEYRATVANFSAPMKELEALARQGRLHHDGNPVLAWMMSNVVAHIDAKDNVYPRKQRPELKIDGVVAAIMALGRHMAMDGSGGQTSFWENAG